MAITNTWSVSNMVHQDSDGGVIPFTGQWWLRTTQGQSQQQKAASYV